MSIRFIIDSTTDLNPAISHRFTVVPLTINFGKEEFIDGITISHKEFYEKLIETDALPSTSQATPAAFEKVFDEVDAAGDSAVVITLSHKLSGTFQSAVIAADGRENIHLVDSGSAAIGAGILAELALQLADEGMDAAQIVARLIEERKNIRVIALLDTLEYLKRGGRISSSAAAVGTLLNIKPILHLTTGKLESYKKARGMNKACETMLEAIRSDLAIRFQEAHARGDVRLLAAGSADKLTTAKWLKQIGEAFPGMPILYDDLSMGVSCHTGEGALGVGLSVRPTV